jgi:hypothetical protein
MELSSIKLLIEKAWNQSVVGLELNGRLIEASRSIVFKPFLKKLEELADFDRWLEEKEKLSYNEKSAEYWTDTLKGKTIEKIVFLPSEHRFRIFFTDGESLVPHRWSHYSTDVEIGPEDAERTREFYQVEYEEKHGRD